MGPWPLPLTVVGPGDLLHHGERRGGPKDLGSWLHLQRPTLAPSSLKGCLGMPKRQSLQPPHPASSHLIHPPAPPPRRPSFLL